MRHLSKLFLALAVLVVGASPALAKAPWEYCPDGTTYGGFFIRDGEYWVICNTGGGGGMSTVNSPFVRVPIAQPGNTGGGGNNWMPHASWYNTVYLDGFGIWARTWDTADMALYYNAGAGRAFPFY